MDNHSDKIDLFLTNQMTLEENNAFLNELKNDKDLREEALMTALLIKEMKNEQAKQDEEIVKEVKKRKNIKIVRRIFSVAAMLILVFGATWLWYRPSGTEVLFADYYTSYIMQGDSRGGDSDVEKELSTLFNQVGTEKDVSAVIDKLQKIYDSIDSEYEYSLFADDIAWYLALAYLKDDKPEKAKELLKPLAVNGHEKAVALIKEIK